MAERKVYYEKAKREYVIDRVYDILPKELKECAKCHWALPKSEFNKSEVSADRLHTWCKLCVKEYRQKYHILNKERENRQSRQWDTDNKEKRSKWARTRRLRMYGLTDEEYNELLESQNGKCAICGLPQLESNWSFCVDHDHKNDKVRGLLCFSCNVILGHIKDNTQILISAVEYLERSLVSITGGNMAKLTKAKAKKILRHGEVHGKPLTKKQKGFFGARAGGTPVKRKK